jgi:signal transduction histidine kinase
LTINLKFGLNRIKTLAPIQSDTNVKILYIDDDPINRLLVNRVLTSYNFRVIEAETGLEGIKIATQEIPDLILMDINMPGLDGHETTTRMRSLAGLKTTPIVAVTANVTAGDRELALAAGCDGYINKPIDVDKFPQQVMTYLQGRKDTISGAERQHYLDKYSQRLVERLEAKIIELEEANTRLQKVDKVKSDFITVAAHELRTPITLVYGYSRLLQSAIRDIKRGSGIDKSVSDLTDRIYHSVHRLNEVVNDILNISLIEADEMSLDHMPVNLEAIIKAALRELDLSKNNRTLNIRLENLENLPGVVGDPERLQQAFWNIFSNAIKFTPDYGSIVIKGWLAHLPEADAESKPFAQTTPESGQSSVIVMIKDTGIGIDPSEQKEIFNRFYMVEDTAYHTSSKTAFGGGGMGLGLPIAKGIIEAHGGRIWVESAGHNPEKNPGSTFYVLLPGNISRP